MIGWHGTHGDFVAFSEASFGSDEGRSPNGRLGVWFFLREGYAQLAGPRVLEVAADIPVDRILRLGVGRMAKDHMAAGMTDDPKGFFDHMRRDLLAKGFQAIEVVENDGLSGMAVILDLSAITSVNDLSLDAAPSMR